MDVSPRVAGRAGTARPGAWHAMSGPAPSLAAPVLAVLAAAAYSWSLLESGYGYAYYAAAARSMSSGPHQFLFAAFDPAGVLAVDKPPLALWVQTASVLVFGYHGWALLLPQVLCGVASVLVLYWSVLIWQRGRPGAASSAALSAFLLLTTPVIVAISGYNIPDPLLVLLLLLAALSVTLANRNRARSRWVWVLATGAFLGCAYLTKMSQALIVVPAVLLALVVGGRGSVGRRCAEVALATVTMVVAGGWWVALTTWLPGPKPFVGSSGDGTAWGLAVGFNGASRLLGDGSERGSMPFRSDPGPLRLFEEPVAGQASWLLPAALAALLVAAVVGIRYRRSGRAHLAGWVLWGGWLCSAAAVLSWMNGMWFGYYTAMLAPATAAVLGAGAVAAARWTAGGVPGGRWVLPVVAALSICWAFVVVSRVPEWHGWLRYPLVAALLLGALLVAIPATRLPGAGVLAAGALLAPVTWSVVTASGDLIGGKGLPVVGPLQSQLVYVDAESRPELAAALAASNGPAARPTSGMLTAPQETLLAYVEQRAGDRTIGLAAEGGAQLTAPLVIAAERVTVISMGGFFADDPVPTRAQLAAWAADGELGFLLTEPRLREEGGTAAERLAWAEQECTPVPADEAGTTPSQILYDCRS